MKKLILLPFFLVAGILAFILLGGINSGDHLSEAAYNGNEKIYIGVFEPLSGFNETGGRQELLGLKYAQYQRPTVYVNGKPYDLEFVVADNASEEQSAKNAAERLVASKVSAVIGSFGSTVSIAGGEVFAREGIPAIGASCSSASVTQGNACYFSVCFSDSFQGGVLADFARGLGLEKMAVPIQAGDSYSRGISRYFIEEFTRLGGEVTQFSFNSVQQNFEPLIDEIKSSDVDGIFMPSYENSASVFIRQVRQQRIDLPIIGGDTWDSSSLIDEIAPYKSNIYFSSSYDPNSSVDSAASAYATRFSSWVGLSEERVEENGGSSYATPYSALAYDAYMVLANAIEQGDSFKPEDIIAQLEVMSYEGVTGSFSFDKNGDCGKTVAYIKTIDEKSGKFTVLRTYSTGR